MSRNNQKKKDMSAAMTHTHEQKYNGSRIHPTMNWEARPDMGGTGPGNLYKLLYEIKHPHVNLYRLDSRFALENKGRGV
jgi:hypothetical protein